MLPPAVAEFRRSQAARTAATLVLTRRQWAQVRLEDLDGSWAAVARKVEGFVAAAQLGAARDGSAMVPAVLAQLDVDVEPDAAAVPAVFAGVASDGRPLGSLLDGAKVRAKAAQSVAAGGAWLDMAVSTAAADAFRDSASVATFTRPRVGWIRVVGAPCCARCAVLAGKWFRSDVAFQRHPRCDCTNMPAPEVMAGALGTDGADLVARGLVRGLSKAESAALGDGADLAKVVNARRGSLGMTTTEGGARGRAGRLRGARLTPSGIYRQAAGDRSAALGMLARHGYIT